MNSWSWFPGPRIKFRFTVRTRSESRRATCWGTVLCARENWYRMVRLRQWYTASSDKPCDRLFDWRNERDLFSKRTTWQTQLSFISTLARVRHYTTMAMLGALDWKILSPCYYGFRTHDTQKCNLRVKRVLYKSSCEERPCPCYRACRCPWEEASTLPS